MTQKQEKLLVEKIIRPMVKKILKEEKEFTIVKDRNGRTSEITGTIDYFIDYFSYTLEKGNSWNRKVIKDKDRLRKMTPQKFVDNLVLAKDSATTNGYDASTDYNLK